MVVACGACALRSSTRARSRRRTAECTQFPPALSFEQSRRASANAPNKRAPSRAVHENTDRARALHSSRDRLCSSAPRAATKTVYVRQLTAMSDDRQVASAAQVAKARGSASDRLRVRCGARRRAAPTFAAHRRTPSRTELPERPNASPPMPLARCRPGLPSARPP